ncbi:MAG: DUF4919 domain-containing protein [Alistipes sp.]|nr:DUF4919 domain-containing protein [Alistipes sp.]
MKRLLILPLLLLAAMTSAAKTPDEDDIAEKTFNASSKYYYPNLMMRYRNGDTTLDEEDYHYLYYGFAYDDNYRPLDPNKALDRLFALIETLNIENPDVVHLHDIISAGEEVMVRDPFSPKVLNIMAYAYGALGESLKEKVFYNHLNNIISTIESSNDGLTTKTPRHVLMFSHARDAIASHGLEFRTSKIMNRSVEYIPLEKPDGKVKGYYFDYSRIYRHKPENTEYHRPRTWQFNNLKPRKYKH